jgi:hypothetical protein
MPPLDLLLDLVLPETTSSIQDLLRNPMVDLTSLYFI